MSRPTVKYVWEPEDLHDRPPYGRPEACVSVIEVPTFESRMAIKDQLVEVPMYQCGCGSRKWMLSLEGDCICAKCDQAQARIFVVELAPVKR